MTNIDNTINITLDGDVLASEIAIIQQSDFYLHATHDYLISFMEHTINQHNINCSAMTFDDLDFQHSTLKHNKIRS